MLYILYVALLLRASVQVRVRLLEVVCSVSKITLVTLKQEGASPM